MIEEFDILNSCPYCEIVLNVEPICEQMPVSDASFLVGYLDMQFCYGCGTKFLSLDDIREFLEATDAEECYSQ